MTQRERLEAVFALKEPDRTPILGGWIACPEYIVQLANSSMEQFWSDPIGVSVRAYENLGTDGLINIYVPANKKDYRIVDHTTYQRANKGLSLEDTLAQIDALPTPEEIEAQFDFATEYEKFKSSLNEVQKRCGEMVWMPSQWEAGAKVTWYADFGYENFFYVVGLYLDRAQKLMEVGGARGRCRSRLVAQAVHDGFFPHAVFLGEDICYQTGSMLSPKFMEKYYAPNLRYSLEPLLKAGGKPVWHCDGDVRQLLDILIDCGVQGLQGFQRECGMLLEELVERRTRDGQKLIIFGPLSVITELPVCTPKEIIAKVHQAIEICKGKAYLVIFSANTINPDVPLENIKAMYQAVLC